MALLQAVDNGLGGQVLARYRSARLAEMTRASELPWVVDAISHRADAGFSEQGPADVVSFTYQGGLYDFSEREFLGFKVVEAKRPAFAADGTSLGTAVQRNEFYQAEASTTDARNPLKGLVKSATTSDEAGTLEVLRTEDAYELVPPSSGNIWRVRKTSSKELTCSEPQCLSNRARIENLTTFSDFDNYDNPRQEVVTATRSSVGDGFDGSIVIKHARTYQNNVIDWIIGLPATYARSFTSGDLPLASEAYLYDRNKLSRKTVARLGGDSSCAQSPAAFINTTVYNPDGTVYEVNNNNDTFVGGQQPRRTFVYDSATTSLPAEVSDYYVREGAAAVLTAKFTYDYRFGTVKTVEDPNGNITQTLRDSLNRPSVELSAEGQTLREYIYSWNLRPILTIAVTNPSTPTEFVQPIFERQHSDGAGRSLQTQVFDAIRSWKRYNTLGQVSESAAPFITGTEDYRKPSQIAAMSAPTTKLTADAYGREVRRLLPDARVKTTAYGVGRQTTVDARGTPRFHYLDALGRVVAADEAYRSPSQSGPFTPGTFTAIRTVVTRDGDGNITTAVDPELRSRSFTYDHQGRVTKAGTATGDYLYCYDGVGAETLSKTPDGRKVKTSRDEIGRVTAYTHEPAVQFGTDDVTFHYDSATASNGKGRLTSSNGSAGSIAFSYDVRGNVVSRNYTTQFGTLGTPFGDAAYSSTAGYDLIGRKLSETVPTDPVHATGATTVTYEYDERGLGRKVSVNETLVVDIDEVTASGKAKSAVYRDGSSDSWTYNAINDRLDSAQTTRGLLTLLSYGIQHDNNDNPLAVTRFFGTGPSNQSQDIVKAHTFDTLDRLATATYTGVDAQPRQFSYSYTASGNVSTKDGFTYHYDGTDRQAVSTRTKAAEGITQSFAYDTDGQLLSASPGSNGESWALSWDGGGRVRSVSTSVKLDPELPESTPTDLTFRYGPDGARVLKRVSGTRVVGGVAQNVSYSDVYIGNLELRGTHDAGASGSRAYFNVNFGGAHIQLAFDRTSNRALIRDPGADRYFHRDYLGSTALVTVGSGTVVSSQADQGRFEYAPYGEDLLSDGSARRIQRRYSGKDVDESGLSYFGARYLDPQLGRWTSRDPSALRDPSMGLTNSQSANLFAFADNNPVSNVDPDGKTAAAAADTLKEIAKEVIRAAKEAPVEVKAMIVEGAALAAPFVAAAVVGAAIGFAAVHGDGKGQFGTIDTQFLMKSKGGGSDKQVAASNEGTGSQSGSSTPSGKPEKPAGGGDTGSTTGNRPPNLSPPGAGRQGAFNEAKRANQIPTSQQPVRTGPNTDKNGNVQPGRTYEYEVPAAGGGTKTVRIRDDAAGHTYPDNPSQNRGPHFNDSKKRHYDY